ncbi:hypothetical protein CVT26_002485 [Gymnopilus dilepis]|uniref:Uncharacterized protein n=1 Tax=Gymnopilus dilepis TaxID=231916 RepID=A0A409Y3V2_9AGAR|nr:hypothetical protein CVT26_002485 [Gymnopilus dilepis]
MTSDRERRIKRGPANAVRLSDLYYNLDVNPFSTEPTQLQPPRPNTACTASTKNWRAFLVYTTLLDNWAVGNPTNNDDSGTVYEYESRETQLRFGGDLKGLVAKPGQA